MINKLFKIELLKIISKMLFLKKNLGLAKKKNE